MVSSCGNFYVNTVSLSILLHCHIRLSDRIIEKVKLMNSFHFARHYTYP